MRIALALLLLGACVLGVGCGSASSSAPPTTSPKAQTRTFRVPYSSMEPTLNCAKPAPGCLGTADDHVLVQPGKPVKRGDIVAFKAPSKAAVDCAMIMGGVYLKRVVGLPGDTVHEDGQGFIHINGKRPSEPYVPPEARRQDALHGHTWHVAKGGYFLMGDNRPMSCDSRTWGSVPQHKIIGPVVKIIHMH